MVEAIRGENAAAVADLIEQGVDLKDKVRVFFPLSFYLRILGAWTHCEEHCNWRVQEIETAAMQASNEGELCDN